ncbi:hypothetical protein [Alterisphingorhabdus coralli]|uniref:Ferric reductase like transmembrane component n=1 Tax=Alterisphingorhabdus coralli TaxID=3071408 RepID=A0AA97FAI1_9SPHN|nr:hypothetical protein [Parasphingorhabdus sp. SCSIO 66989]WOE76163.1 hypothetical protein RB602_05470 [Parasphingorhabdus sp. SCSIO 66989]
MASAAKPAGATHGSRRRQSQHVGFLGHNGFKWLKIAVFLSLVCLVSYFLIDVEPRHNGGSWYGYTLGTIGALLILWLTMLGLRKRTMTPGGWSLKAWTSAHVYLGLSLIVIGTLHTGFQLGWNVHTLAWALMMIVIISGIFGIYAYATLPQSLSNNRDEMTETQMIEALRSLDRQLHDAAQPLEPEQAALVQSSLEQDPFAGGLIQRLSNSYPGCATRKAQAELRRSRAYQPRMGDDPLDKIDNLLERKEATLARVRRHLQIKGLLQIWLYVHVPMTFALLAALSAHIVSVFFYW